MKKSYKIYLTRKSGEDSRNIVYEFEKKINPMDKTFDSALYDSAPFTKEVLADFMIEVFHKCDGFTFPILIITDENDKVREIYETYIDEAEEDGNITGIQNWTDHTLYWNTEDEYDYFKGVER